MLSFAGGLGLAFHTGLYKRWTCGGSILGFVDVLCTGGEVVRLLNERTPDERLAHDRAKRFCVACRRSVRVKLDQRVSMIVWTGRQAFPPRRFQGSQMRVVEEVWDCPECPRPMRLKGSRIQDWIGDDEEEGRSGVTVGRIVEHEHVGGEVEIVASKPGALRGATSLFG